MKKIVKFFTSLIDFVRHFDEVDRALQGDQSVNK